MSSRQFAFFLNFWLVIFAAILIAFGGHTSAASAAVRCTEDAPCWTWSKMGNHRRGVVTLYGNVRVVGPCAFSRLWKAGHLRYSSLTVDGVRYTGLLKPLRGDVWARRYGCEAR